jgi:hypothetical protein
LPMLLAQLLVQGLLSGVIAVVAFSRAAQILGAAAQLCSLHSYRQSPSSLACLSRASGRARSSSPVSLSLRRG